MTTRRWTYAQCLKELAGALSTLARADVHYGRPGDYLHDALVFKARMAILEARRVVRSLRARSRTVKARKAA